MLRADQSAFRLPGIRRDYARTVYADLSKIDPARVAEAFAAMETAGTAMLDAASVPLDRRALPRFADVRYRRQAYELTLPVEAGPVTSATLTSLASAFHDRHMQTYGHANREEPVQLVNLRLSAIGRLPVVNLAQPHDPASARTRIRDVWFSTAGFVPAQVHWRNGLAPGCSVAGPAVIEALDSTTVVPPGWAANIDDRGYIRLQLI